MHVDSLLEAAPLALAATYCNRRPLRTLEVISTGEIAQRSIFLKRYFHTVHYAPEIFKM